MSYLTDGFSCTIGFASGSSGVELAVKEKSVTPPGVSAGGAIDSTTMRNSIYRTKVPKKLIDMANSSLEVQYDPACYDEIIAMIGDNQLITITFPDSSTLAFYGWLDEFVPNALVEGEEPTAGLTLICSNQTDGTETAPVYNA